MLGVIVVAKSLPATAIVLAFRYPVSSALTVSVGLAQIGEFSLILAGLGVGLGLLPPEGRDLILAAALLSITLNPLVFIAADRSAAWLRARPRLMTRLERPGQPLAAENLGLEAAKWQGHAVIVGYGRVGSRLAKLSGSRICPLSWSSETVVAPRTSGRTVRRLSGAMPRRRRA
jgi:CPA2 family monovalent cation:H+ antiporter-2